MKRDLQIIRDILIAVENHTGTNWVDLNTIKHDQQNVIYNAFLLLGEGYIDADDISSKDGKDIGINQLTWKGHDFIDATRDKTIWNRTIKFIKDKGGSFTIDIAKSIALDFIGKNLGIK